MGLLGEIFSAGDSAKRKLKGLLSDPLGELGLLGNRMAEDIQNQLDVYSKAYPLDPRLNPRLDTAQGREMVVDQNVARNKLAEMAANMGMAGTFIGPTARTWDALAAKRAQDLYAKKVDPRIIWKETGTFKGPDGLLRQEIDDSASDMLQKDVRALREKYDAVNKDWERAAFGKRYKGQAADSARLLQERNMVEAELKAARNPSTIGDYFGHEKLFSSYGGLDKIPASVTNGPELKGHYVIANRDGKDLLSTEQIGLAAPTGEAKRSGLLHELQHAIQQREGWARGGSPEVAFRDPRMWGDGAEGSDIARKMLKDKLKEMSTPMPVEKYAKEAWQSDVVTPEILAAYKDYAKTIKSSARQFETEAQKTVAQEWYRRLAGEAEARATQSRMNMDAAKRREVFPLDSYDVPLNELIIRLGAKP